MKIATYNDGSRDGQLVVVSRDLTTAHYATGIAGRLQQVVDDWNFLAPQLEELSQTLEPRQGTSCLRVRPAPLRARRCHAPPCGSSRTAVAAGAAASAGPIGLLGPRATAARCGRSARPAATGRSELPRQLAVLTGDIAAAGRPSAALDGVRLLLLACSVHRRMPAARGRQAR